MATNKKNEFPVIDDEKLNIAIRAFVDTFKKNEKRYLEMGVNVEEVESLIERFRDKAALTAISTTIAVVVALPIKEFIAFSKTFEAIQKVKLLEAFMERVQPNGADNDIDN